MAKLPMPEPPAVVADIIRMPTHAELSSSSAAVDLPDCITGGVSPQDYLKFGLELPHIIQTEKLTGKKFKEGLPAAVEAFLDTFRIVDGWASQDLVVNADARPYTKVFTRAYLTVRCLFCYSFV